MNDYYVTREEAEEHNRKMREAQGYGDKTSYHQRFRERFTQHQIDFEGMVYEKPEDILAFIDEVVADEIKFGYDHGMQDGKDRERTALIEKVEGMKKPMPNSENWEFYWHIYQPVYNTALDDILTYLRDETTNP